jgi:hypothetical protein
MESTNSSIYEQSYEKFYNEKRFTYEDLDTFVKSQSISADSADGLANSIAAPYSLPSLGSLIDEDLKIKEEPVKKTEKKHVTINVGKKLSPKKKM